MRYRLKSLTATYSEKITIILMSTFGCLLGLATITYSQNEDMGIFMSEAAIIANGQALYSQIYEIKDPLFLYAAAISTKLLGIQGPFLLDAFMVSISTPLSYLASRKLGFSEIPATTAAVVFTGTLSGVYFQSFRSGIAALVLVLACFLCASYKNWILLGILAILVVGFKMSYALFLMGPLLLIFATNNRAQAALRFSTSAIFTGVLFIGILARRNELSGYLEMIRVNFEYRSTGPAIAGLPEGVGGHIALVNSFGSNFWILLVLIFFQILITLKLNNKDNNLVSVSLILLSASVLVVLMLSTMWPHHMQVLCLFAWSSTLIFLEATANHLKFPEVIISFAVIQILITLQLTGWRIPNVYTNLFAKASSPSWQIPPEVNYINSNKSKFQGVQHYARLGPNDDLGLAAFLDDNFILVCRDYSQVGLWESEARIIEIRDCIKKMPEVVFVSSGFNALVRPTGNYEELKRIVNKVLSQDFICQEIDARPGAFVCIRVKE